MRVGYGEDQKQSTLEVLELELALLRSRKQSFALFLIGLDRFRALSDVLGYSFGEEVLSLAQQRIAASLREPDSVVRLTNDEFVVLLPCTPCCEESSVIARRLAAQLQCPYTIRGEVVNVSVTIGIVLGPQHGLQAELLLNRAGIALRSAKASGLGTIELFSVAMEERIRLRHLLIADLQQALALNQLEVHYQPQVSMSTRQATGLEALLRWRHPSLGMISPAEFVPIAEQTGLITAIGEWVLHTACRQAALLPHRLVMAVNASPIQFRDCAFVGTVERALAAAKLAPERLEIEVTEGILLEHTDNVLNTLNRLHAAGVRLAIDDFGTGYSSLGQLAKLPFDTIKIDRALVGPSLQQRAIVRSIVALGNGLGMSVLAEGLETEEEYDNARTAGCLVGQGYLLGKPIPAHQIQELLSRLSRQAIPVRLSSCRRTVVRKFVPSRGGNNLPA